MKSTLSRPRAARTSKPTTATVTGPLKLHRTWKEVPTHPGDIEKQLIDAGLKTQLLEVREILARCSTGITLEISAFEVAEDKVLLNVAIAALEGAGYTPCCSCEAAFWAIEHGNDVHQKTTWLTLLQRRTEDKQRAVMTLRDKIVRTEVASNVLLRGTMLLGVRKDLAAKHRKKDTQ